MKSSLEKQLRDAERVRKFWAKSDRKRDCAVKERLDVVQIRNLSYKDSPADKDCACHLFDIYYPRQITLPEYPVIVNVHGGGWFYGDKELYAPYAKYLASKGFAVVNFNYRLAPVHRYPSAFEDVCALMEYLIAHAESFRLNLSCLNMTGDSAGAQLAAQYAVFATNPDYRAFFPSLSDVNVILPQKLALNCGLYRLDETRKQFSSDWYLPETVTTEIAESAFRMLSYLTPEFPSCYVMGSVNDTLLEESRMLHQKLTELDVLHIYREFGEGNPKSGHVFHLNLMNPEGEECNSQEILFFNGGLQ